MRVKKFISIVAVIMFCGVIFTGCSKYEDGPSISLLSKISRLTGVWNVTTMNGHTIDSDYESVELTFDKDGDYNSKITILSISYSSDAKWQWADGKEVIQIIDENQITEFTVTRLTKDEFWFMDDDDELWECEKMSD